MLSFRAHSYTQNTFMAIRIILCEHERTVVGAMAWTYFQKRGSRDKPLRFFIHLCWLFDWLKGWMDSLFLFCFFLFFALAHFHIFPLKCLCMEIVKVIYLLTYLEWNDMVWWWYNKRWICGKYSSTYFAVFISLKLYEFYFF